MEIVLVLAVGIIAALVKRLTDRSGASARTTRRQRFLEQQNALQARRHAQQWTQWQAGQQASSQYPPTALSAPVARGLTDHRPPEPELPMSDLDLDARVRELMAAHSEVGAIRLLCDERDLGIIEAQAYVRSLAAPTSGTSSSAPAAPTADPPQDRADARDVGSAAFATSVFDLDADEDSWASGWVDKPEPDDRSDVDELWQTVRRAGRQAPS